MPRWCRDAGLRLLVVTAMWCAGVGVAPAQLVPPIDAATSAAAILHEALSLHLDVSVNDGPTHSVQPFVLTPPDHLAAQRAVLEAIGIAVDGSVAPTGLVALDSLTGVTYRLDLSTQSIAFHLPDARRQRKVYDSRGPSTAAAAPAPDWGGFLNYSLFASEEGGAQRWFRYSGANASIDAHVFGPYGAVDQTAIIGDTLGRDHTALRLETGYTFRDQDRMLSGRIGDAITGGLNWTRPIRFGGVQVSRDFALQPGLVTQPLPSFTGSAAVPSTVDVFVGSAKLLSEKVDPGPFQLVNIPNLSNGVANVVVTDATGRQTQSSLQLYNAVSLLRPTLVDFSLEGGLARRNFGVLSNDYDMRPVASATLRAGLTPWMTTEGHAEIGAGVINASAGLVAGTPWGTVEGGAGLSHDDGRFGGLLYAAYNVEAWGVLFRASAQVRTDAFDDVAGATARWQGTTGGSLGKSPFAVLGAGLFTGFTSDKPPKSLAQISAFVPLPFWSGTASISLIDLHDDPGPREDLLSASVNLPLPYHVSLFGTVFADVAGRGAGRSVGLLAGLTVPIGDNVSASVSGGIGASNTTVTAQKAIGREAGSFGWQLADLESAQPVRLASAAYRTGLGTVGAGVTQDGRSFGGTASLDGSIATMGGAVALGEHIDESFAMVEAGIPGVAILQDNRLIGTTDPFGHLVVPTLGVYQPNRISLDPLSIPARAETASTESIVVPSPGSGFLVNFGGERDVRAGMIVLLDGAGHPLAPGSKGRLDGAGDAFVVGYGGQAYIRHLRSSNAATVETGVGECHVSFPFAASAADAAPRTAQCL